MSTNLSANAKPWAPESQPPFLSAVQCPPPPPVSASYGGTRAMYNGPMGHDAVSYAPMPPPPMPSLQQQQPPFMSAASNVHKRTPPTVSPNAAKLFVGQLPFECTEERLRNLFSAYGNVEHIHILRDVSNRSRGAAFITYSNVEEADTAIFTLHNRYRMLTNRAIQVSYAKNSPNISPFGTCSALEVHQSNPTNPVPDVAAVGTQTRLF